MINKHYKLIPFLCAIFLLVQCNSSNPVEHLSNQKPDDRGQAIAKYLHPGIERTVYHKTKLQESNLQDFQYSNYSFKEKHNGIPGLEINSVHAISKDEIIVATYNKIGILNDGQWQCRHHYNTGIPNDRINIVKQSKDGNILIGYYNTGFVMFSENGIETFDKESLGWAGFEIYDFFKSDDGVIHLSTGRDYGQIKDGEFINLTKRQSDPSINKNFPFAPRKYSKGPGNYLYASHYDQLLRYSKNTWKPYSLPEHPTRIQHYGIVANQFFIYALGKNSDEIYILKNNKWEKLTLAPTSINPTALTIHAISKDEFYVIFNNGINHIENGQLTSITLRQMGLKANSFINSSSLAPDGTLAIGGNHGMAVLNNGIWTIHNADKSLVHSKQFFEAASDAEDNVFLTHDKGITKLNKSGSSTLVFDASDTDLGIPQNIAISESGKIYFSTFDNLYDFSDQTPKSVVKERVFVRGMDIQNEYLAYGTGKDIGLYNGSETEIIKDPMIKSAVSAIHYGKDGTLYVGTTSIGGKLFEYKNGSIQAIDDKFSQDINNRIVDIHSFGSETVAASNYGWMKKKKGKWENMPKHLPEENEPANGVQAIMIGQSKKIYLVGRYGKLYIYHPNGNYETVDLNKFFNLDTIDKVNGIFQDEKGDIYILSVNGLLIYYGD